VSLGGFAEAVTRVGSRGRAPEDWMLAQRITLQEAVTLLTTAAAYGGFEEDQKGSLAPGMLADLIIISADPFEIPAEELAGLEVLVTVVGGEVVFCGAEALSLCHDRRRAPPLGGPAGSRQRRPRRPQGSTPARHHNAPGMKGSVPDVLALRF